MARHLWGTEFGGLEIGPDQGAWVYSPDGRGCLRTAEMGIESKLMKRLAQLLLSPDWPGIRNPRDVDFS